VIDLDAVTTELLTTLGHLAGVVLLDLGKPSLLLGLELELTDMLPRQADALARRDQSTIGIALSSLGTHDSLASLDDAGVHLGNGAIAKGSVQQAAMPTRAAGISGVAGDADIRVSGAVG